MVEFDEKKFLHDMLDLIKESFPDLISYPIEDIAIIKSWETVLQYAIEEQFPDKDWWEIYDESIFDKLSAGEEPGKIADEISATLSEKYPKQNINSSLDTEAKDMSAAKDVQDVSTTGHDKDKGAI